jgi:hypothetical protein
VSFTKHKRVPSTCYACHLSSHLSKLDIELKGTLSARAKRAVVAEQKRIHARFYVNERTHLHHQVCQAMDAPELMACATADGMDSVKTCCPCYPADI